LRPSKFNSLAAIKLRAMQPEHTHCARSYSAYCHRESGLVRLRSSRPARAFETSDQTSGTAFAAPCGCRDHLLAKSRR
jgi:hypothetical protein